jgi:hypothetical protein
MKQKYFFMIIIIILMTATVILTHYRTNKMSKYIESFYNLDSCSKNKTCKRCLSIGHCAWTRDNTCILIPQNITGHITAKLDCPVEEVDVVIGTENSLDSVPAPINDNINVSLSQTATSNTSIGLNNSVLSGVPIYVSQQNLLGQQQSIARDESQSESIARRNAGNAEAIVAGAVATEAAHQHNQYGAAVPPKKK